MSVFRRPLVALSLTEPDVGLLRYAAQVAGRGSGCEAIRFAHVLPSDAPPLDEDDIHDTRERMSAEVRAHFGFVPPSVAYDVVRGPRLDQLLNLLVQHEHDVILLGHRKQRSGKRSLARRLAMVAPCSVWLVPEGALDRVSRVLVPVDFSSHSADALSVATALAAARGIKHCQAAHVFFDPSTIRYDEHVAEVVGNEQAAFEKFIAGVERHGVAVEPLFEESTHAAEAILRIAKRHQTDLIVMNTRGRSRSAAVLLGSVTSDIMSATPVPLLAVKHYGSRMTLAQALVNHRFWESRTPKTN